MFVALSPPGRVIKKQQQQETELGSRRLPIRGARRRHLPPPPPPINRSTKTKAKAKGERKRVQQEATGLSASSSEVDGSGPKTGKPSDELPSELMIRSEVRWWTNRTIISCRRTLLLRVGPSENNPPIGFGRRKSNVSISTFWHSAHASARCWLLAAQNSAQRPVFYADKCVCVCGAGLGSP